MQHCINIYYFMFKWGSTCFGRHTAHHRELKTALAASGFAYVRGCWTLWLLDADSVQQPQRPTTSHVCKTRACLSGFELLMMGGVSPETCWALFKHGIINVDTVLHLIGYFYMNYTMIHGSTNIKSLIFTFTTLTVKLMKIIGPRQANYSECIWLPFKKEGIYKITTVR